LCQREIIAKIQREINLGKVMLPSEERIRLLSLVDIFEPLSKEEIERLNGQLSDIHLETGEIFYSPEDRSEKLFLLQKGRVRVYKSADRRELTLAIVEAGTVFGEMALTAQRLQEAYAQAMEPSEVSVMHREDLERLILEKPEVGLRITHLLSERLRRYEIRLEDISLKGVSARLASLILSLIESEGVVVGKNYVKIPTHHTHQHLATMIGANREAVTKAFARLQDARIVELKRRLIYVADIEALSRMAGHMSGGNEEEEWTS
jgi:CRP/FNR family cyclic AMP-dependent transcriptional regulator